MLGESGFRCGRSSLLSGRFSFLVACFIISLLLPTIFLLNYLSFFPLSLCPFTSFILPSPFSLPFSPVSLSPSPNLSCLCSTQNVLHSAKADHAAVHWAGGAPQEQGDGGGGGPGGHGLRHQHPAQGK